MPERGWRQLMRVNALWFAITLALTGLALLLVLQLWRADPHVPPSVGLDNEVSLMVIKNVLSEGWVNHAPLLGAPFGQQLYDFPVFSGDLIHLLVIKGIGFFTDDPALAMNCFYRLSFFLVAASAFWALRLVKVSPPASAAVAVLYSFLPYHFVREYFGHLTLSAYYAVPLACALVIRQLGDEPLFELRRARGHGREARLRRSRCALALAICVLVGVSGVYYAVFTVLLLAFTGLARGITVRSARALLSSLVLSGLVGAVAVATLLPNLLYFQRHGVNRDAAPRVALESEIYGLKIVNLVLPTPGHRIPALDVRSGEDERTLLPSEGTETLGMLGTAGFIGLLLLAFRRLLGSAESLSAPAKSMATLLLFTVLLGTVAGFSAVFAAFGFVQIRAWNRISVFAAFFALGAVALAVDWLSARARGRKGALVRLGLALLVLVVGVADQTTPRFVPRYEDVSRIWRSDRSFIQAVERRYGQADVFQLPIVPFPESPPVWQVTGYAHLRGYLHSDTLRWSFGGMRGRETYWQDQLLSLPPLEVVPRVALGGFEALYIDRNGYRDHGEELERQLDPYVDQPLVSPGGRLAVYDLRPLRRELESRFGAERARQLGELVTHPVRLEWDEGFTTLERGDKEIWKWAEEDAHITLFNGSDRPRDVVFGFELEALPQTSVRIDAGEQSHLLPASDERHRLRFGLRVVPGETKVHFRSLTAPTQRGPDARVARRIRLGPGARGTLGDARFRLINPRVDEGGRDMATLLRAPPRPPTARAPAMRRPAPVPRPEVPPLLVVAAILAWGMVFTAASSIWRRALVPWGRRWEPRQSAAWEGARSPPASLRRVRSEVR